MAATTRRRVHQRAQGLHPHGRRPAQDGGRGLSGLAPGADEAFESLYRTYNRREFVHPDPLEFLYRYEDLPDREVAGIVASALAFGRVTQILKSVSLVLERMGPSPRAFLDQMSHRSLKGAFPDFKHRWTTGEDVSALLIGVREALGRHGTLNSCFIAGMGPGDRDVVNALAGFSRELGGGSGACDYLLPSPEKGSACKRLNLFLRWMVRSDDVDPGGWAGVPPAALLIPLDTHMYRVGTELGFTQRKQPGLRAALEITDGFRSMAPDDPVRYDFSLTRLGMRGGGALEEFLDTVDRSRR